MHQYMIRILYKPGAQLYTADWLSRHNHTEGKDEEIAGMNMNINVVEIWTDIPECMMAEEIRHDVQADNHLNTLTAYVINDWP